MAFSTLQTMNIRKAYKFKLKTTDGIEQKFNIFSGHTRFVWNKVLAMSITRLENKQNIFWYNESAHWLTLWKQSEDYGFLKECHSQVLQQKLKDLDKAFKDCFDKKQPLKRLPRFKKKHQSNSIRFPAGFKFDNRRVYLPKIGWVGFFKSQDIVGTLKNVTISKGANGWFMSVQVETTVIAKSKATTAIGVDLGVKQFVTCSDGLVVAPVNSGRANKTKLAKLQRNLARKVKFSNNWRKQKLKITKLHSKIKNTRHDFLHKTSNELSKNHAIIFVEDLKISNMSKSAKGDLENPGRNVKAKSGLNRVILEQAWSEFVRQLEYKSQWQGNEVHKVNPKYTSQKCSCCGYTDKANRKTQEFFNCLVCNHEENADINASKNILAAGHAVLACGEDALATSMKQEPQLLKQLRVA
ncbi:Mobile element protein [hydrothermal vent metagenome]|uniref:Mobile element protein n=1 Tax=hydrothermal vent metagenome TaxID=652676 RepID=A0A3B0VZU4_9ZZZZ